MKGTAVRGNRAQISDPKGAFWKVLAEKTSSYGLVVRNNQAGQASTEEAGWQKIQNPITVAIHEHEHEQDLRKWHRGHDRRLRIFKFGLFRDL